MGKREKKHKKDKKHKHKKEKKQKKYSSSESSSAEDEWIEKPSTSQPAAPVPEESPPKIEQKREDWFSLPANFLTASSKELKETRYQEKQAEKAKQQYNPETNVRELNPYWKDNGTGLPAFKKPTFDDNDAEERYKSKSSSSRSRSFHKPTKNWQKDKTDKISQSTSSSPQKPTIKTPEKHVESNEPDDEVKILSQKEMNALAAKQLKAEIMGNTSLATKLKQQLEDARKMRDANPQGAKEQDVILTQTDSKGYTRPLQNKETDTSKQAKKRKLATHDADGERTRYFADDDKYSLKQMFEHEKFNTSEKQNEEFLSILGRSKTDDLDDIFTDNIRQTGKEGKEERRERDRAIASHQKMSDSLDNCTKCPQSNSAKHLIVSMGTAAYLCLPSREPLTPGHCMIVPTRHAMCATQLDENEWEEIADFRKSLTQMYASRGEDVIFFEVARNFHRFPHMVIDCVPMDREIGDLAPIYFKKAIDESETEWATNKKLVKLEGRNVRRAIPKGLPYFFVSFGMQEGFAHVIEDEQAFPGNFAQEIIGGMLDLHHSKWRNPKRQRFEEQSARVKEFAQDWKQFDHKNA